MLFMLMIVLKHTGQWGLLGRVFKIKGPTFERMITRFTTLVSSELYKVFVTDLVEPVTLNTLRETETKFIEFP